MGVRLRIRLREVAAEAGLEAEVEEYLRRPEVLARRWSSEDEAIEDFLRFAR